jgi:uncharacterized protein
MPVDDNATAFVSGSDSFLGRELVEVLRAGGHHVLGHTDSLEEAHSGRRAGVTPVVGNMLEPGPWQDEAAAADWIFHLPPHRLARRVSRRRGEDVAEARLVTDARLLDAVAGGQTRRIVYVADTSFYGPTGPRAITEDTPPRPAEWGRLLAPALERIEGYVVSGLPVVTAFAGWVYGNGSWFREWVIDPVVADRRVVQIGTVGPWVSPIHAQDCARALAHLAEHGEPGGRYFLVNNDPIRLYDLARTFARHAHRRLRVRRLPKAAANVVFGPALADHIQTDAVFSNARLRGIGFRFRYPTLDLGMLQVLGATHD